MANDKPKGFGIGAYNVPRDTEQPPQPPSWLERETGLPAAVRNLGEQASQSNLIFGAPPPGTPRESSTIPQLLKSFFTGMPAETIGTSPDPDLGSPQTPMFTDGRVISAIQAGQMDTGQIPFSSAGGQYQPTLLEQAMAYGNSLQGGGSGGVAAPDYSQYRQALTDQAGQINAQIQAMYNALGDEAAANVSRIEDIYGGAQAGIGDVYESAAANTADAYGSSQQQAADQLARLGIEAAAPAVVNPMALSQAEALSGLEAGRAGGEAATERYGASAGGFGSQMAQVAQQQGTEMNAAVLNALQNRLNETLLMEEQGRQAAASSGGGGQSAVDAAMDFLRLQEMASAPAMAQQELDFKASQIAADNTLAQEDKLVRLWSDIRNDYGSDEEAWQAAQTAISQAQSFYR